MSILPRRCLGHVLLCVACLAASTAGAEVFWWFDFAGSNPKNVPSVTLERITEAMDSAVEFYNAYSDYPRSTYSDDPRGLRVIYNENVATANASFRGRIAFGGKINDWTAMHEMAHVFGIGTIGAWNQNRNASNNTWSGPAAIAELEDIDGPGAVLSADSIHFWPYGLNTQDGDRHAHVRLVGALREDMGRSNDTFRFDASDFNHDGFLDTADLQIFKDNWLKSHEGFGNQLFGLGDRNMDGVTDLADWVLIRGDFMDSGGLRFLEAFSVPAVVPEPNGWFTAIGLGTMFTHWWRKQNVERRRN